MVIPSDSLVMPSSTMEDPVGSELHEIITNRQTRISNEKWKITRQFYGQLKISTQVFLRSFRSNCFNREEKRFLSRTGFSHIMKEYCGRDLSRMVATVYDPNQRGYIDYREIMFQCFVLSNFDLSPREALISAFDFFTDSSSKVKGEAIQDILLYLLSPETLPEFLDKFYEKWVNIRLEGTNHWFEGNFRVIGERISFRLYSEIVESIVVESDTDEAFECKFYPSYLQQIQESRRHIRHCLERVTTSAKKFAIVKWQKESNRRQKAHETFSRIAFRLHRRKNQKSFDLWKRHTMFCLATVEIQRSLRGFLARKAYQAKMAEERSSILIQSVARRCLVHSRYKWLQTIRDEAAYRIQTCFRWHQEQIIQKKRLETALDVERTRQMKLEQKANEMMANRGFTRLQRIFRSNLMRKEIRKSVAKRQREIKVLNEMNLRQALLQQEKEIHERQACAFRERRLAQIEIAEKQLERNFIQKKTLQKRRFMEKIESIEKREQNEQYRKDQSALETLKENWEKDIAKQCTSLQKLCSDSLRNAETASEKELKKKILSLSKKKLKGVLKFADSQNRKMELKEANDIALKLAVDDCVSAKKAELQNLMMKAVADTKRTLSILREQRNKEVSQLKLENAKKILHSALLQYIARRKVQAIAKVTFEKIYNEKYEAFYYRNKRTGELSWYKPKTLGNEDVPTST